MEEYGVNINSLIVSCVFYSACFKERLAWCGCVQPFGCRNVSEPPGWRTPGRQRCAPCPSLSPGFHGRKTRTHGWLQYYPDQGTGIAAGCPQTLPTLSWDVASSIQSDSPNSLLLRFLFLSPIVHEKHRQNIAWASFAGDWQPYEEMHFFLSLWLSAPSAFTCSYTHLFLPYISVRVKKRIYMTWYWVLICCNVIRGFLSDSLIQNRGWGSWGQDQSTEPILPAVPRLWLQVSSPCIILDTGWCSCTKSWLFRSRGKSSMGIREKGKKERIRCSGHWYES